MLHDIVLCHGEVKQLGPIGVVASNIPGVVACVEISDDEDVVIGSPANAPQVSDESWVISRAVYRGDGDVSYSCRN